MYRKGVSSGKFALAFIVGENLSKKIGKLHTEFTVRKNILP